MARNVRTPQKILLPRIPLYQYALNCPKWPNEDFLQIFQNFSNRVGRYAIRNLLFFELTFFYRANFFFDFFRKNVFFHFFDFFLKKVLKLFRYTDGARAQKVFAHTNKAFANAFRNRHALLMILCILA